MDILGTKKSLILLKFYLTENILRGYIFQESKLKKYVIENHKN